MLCPDETGTGAQGFLHRILHETLRRWRIACTLTDRHLRIRRDKLRDHIEDFLIIDAIGLQYLRGHRRALTTKTEKDVFGSYVLMAQLLCRFDRELQRTLCLYRKLIHALPPFMKDILVHLGI